MIRFFTLITFIVFSTCGFAASSLDIEIDPTEPVLGEPFKVNFIISSDKGDNPVINFETSSDLEIISRGNSRVSTRTSFVNGKMSYERKITVAYDLVANKSGSEFIKQIEVVLGQETLKKSYLPIRVLKAPRRARPVFVRAEVEKKQFYVGESILVRYFLYNKADISMSATDVKKFPKLDKFLKRYHQEPVSPQRVQINGIPFERRVIYTAQLFGETPGVYKIDPISLNARFSSRQNDPFGNFGFGSLRLGGVKSRTVRSETIKIDILPLPTEGRPANFTGLVGSHKFKLNYNKTKYLANEPIELELVAEGEGLLEVFEAPKILTDDLIEEFESTADLKINQDFTSTKTFDYTYLGRGSVVVPAKTLNLSYFDPKTKSYKIQSIEVASFEVVAVGSSSSNKAVTQVPKIDGGGDSIQNQPMAASTVGESELLKPVYKTVSSFVFYSKHLFWIVGIALFILLFILLYRLLASLGNRDLGVIEEIKREGLTYKNLYTVFERISVGNDLTSLINNSPLSDKTKEYFLDVYQELRAVFRSSDDQVGKGIQAKAAPLKELRKKLETHENI